MSSLSYSGTGANTPTIGHSNTAIGSAASVAGGGPPGTGDRLLLANAGTDLLLLANGGTDHLLLAA